MWDKQPCRHCGDTACGGWCTEPSCDTCQDMGEFAWPHWQLPSEPCDSCRPLEEIEQWHEENPEGMKIHVLRARIIGVSYNPPVPMAGYNPMAGGIDQDKHMIEAPLIGHRQKAADDLEIQIQAQYRQWIERVKRDQQLAV